MFSSPGRLPNRYHRQQQNHLSSSGRQERAPGHHEVRDGILQQFSVLLHMSCIMRKPIFGVSDQVRHKLGCTATEDGERLNISGLGSSAILSK